MNSWHVVKRQSPQPGEGLELVVESCGSSLQSHRVLSVGLGGCGDSGGSTGPGPQDCRHSRSSPPPAPADHVILFSCISILCYSCVNMYGILTLLGFTLHVSVDLCKLMLY